MKQQPSGRCSTDRASIVRHQHHPIRTQVQLVWAWCRMTLWADMTARMAVYAARRARETMN